MTPTFAGYGTCRYADDWLLGFSGPREEAEAIKGQLKAFLRETLKLTLVRGENTDHPCAHGLRPLSRL